MKVNGYFWVFSLKPDVRYRLQLSLKKDKNERLNSLRKMRTKITFKMIKLIYFRCKNRKSTNNTIIFNRIFIWRVAGHLKRKICLLSSFKILLKVNSKCRYNVKRIMKIFNRSTAISCFINGNSLSKNSKLCKKRPKSVY